MTLRIPNDNALIPALSSERGRAPRRFRRRALAALPALVTALLGAAMPPPGQPWHDQHPKPSQGASFAASDSAHFRGKAGLVYGPRHAFIVRAPAGWTLDSRSGRRQGLQIVLYPNGQSWSRSPAVIYCQVSPKGASLRSIRELIAGEEQRFRNQTAEAMVAEAPSIRVDDSVTALVRKFSGGRNHAFEATAYIEARTVLVSLVLSCRSAEAFDGAMAAFTEFVRSYRFLADDEENILRAVEAVEDEESQ